MTCYAVIINASNNNTNWENLIDINTAIVIGGAFCCWSRCPGFWAALHSAYYVFWIFACGGSSLMYFKWELGKGCTATESLSLAFLLSLVNVFNFIRHLIFGHVNTSEIKSMAITRIVVFARSACATAKRELTVEITENGNAKIMKISRQWQLCDKGRSKHIENLRHSWEKPYFFSSFRSFVGLALPFAFELISFLLFKMPNCLSWQSTTDYLFTCLFIFVVFCCFTWQPPENKPNWKSVATKKLME